MKQKWQPGPYSRRLKAGNIDGRTREGKLLRDTLLELAEPLGGLEKVGPAERLILDRAAEKVVRCRWLYDRMMAEGELPHETERRYVWFANSLARDLQALGLLGSQKRGKSARNRATTPDHAPVPDPLEYAKQLASAQPEPAE
ncbi:hypothetical protein [Roseospirillum parvum]|uniref:Phage terminase, small subunit, putative, P27 family n=1 Tax=Roseospirillum parvum TaxID=83401 RepID=A0A1G8E6U5_9PROT|nr:hypothetical protein [Roseospirillum parvum]SDH65656.1 hypothetical protein SAMN05421742_10955 [Roseospirillum parvum]